MPISAVVESKTNKPRPNPFGSKALRVQRREQQGGEERKGSYHSLMDSPGIHSKSSPTQSPPHALTPI